MPNDFRPAIAISATFTAEPLQDVLGFWLRELHWDYQTRFAPYNQVFQQLLDPAGLLAGNRDGFNVVLVRLEDWVRYRGGSQPDLAGIEENVHHLVSAVRAAAEGFATPLILVVCPASPRFASAPGGPGFEQRMETLLRESLGDLHGTHLVLPGEIDRLYPVAQCHDPHGDELGHVPFTPAYFAALATMLARKIHALRTPPWKVVALDCDETLWQGICGEDGPEGVVLDPPRRALQEFMRACQSTGMLLCLASKNNEEDVLETFRLRPEMPLRLEDFVARRINWEPKAANLAELAGELQLGLDSFIFIDDNPRECSQVQAECPEVLALCLPADAAGIPDFLRHVWAFDRVRITEEDRRRTALYAQQVERRRLQRSSASLQEFLESLRLEVRIAPATPAQWARVAQLTERTNQMNVAPARRGEQEIGELLRGGAECLAVEVRDRFGDYGLTGVMVFRMRGEVLAVEAFLLSCRALGRGVEHRMLARLGELALERGAHTVEIPFVTAARNRPALLFLESTGAAFREADRFRYPSSYAAGVVYRPDGKAAAPAAEPAREAKAVRTPLDYTRIATDLRSPEALLGLLREHGKPAGAASGDGAAPRTELESQLAALWAELLKLPAVGVHENFFDLGGHSLLVVQLLSHVSQVYGVDLSMEVVYNGDFTVEALAKAIELRQIESAGEYHDLLRELEGLSDEEVRALLAREEQAGRTGGVL